MNTEQIYIQLDAIIKNIDEGKLLTDNNADWAKEAVYNAPYINLDYYVPVSRIDQLIHYCENKIDSYRDTGSISKMECYHDFINMLKSLSIDEDDLIDDLMMEQREQM